MRSLFSRIAALLRLFSTETIASPPPGRARRTVSIFIVAYLLRQVSIPLTYYLSDSRSDERFAWRMFSVFGRSQGACRLFLKETFTSPDPNYVPPQDLERFTKNFISLLQRARIAVVDKLLRARCKVNPLLVSIRLTRTCPAPDGSEVPAGEIELDCFSGALTGRLQGP